MEGQNTLHAVTDYAAEAKNFLARRGLMAEALVDAVRTDENGRPFNPTIGFGGLVEGLNTQNEKERAPRVLSHLQRALTPHPSGRWTALVTRRAAHIKREARPLLAEPFATLYADPRSRPGAWLTAFVAACDAEINTLEQQQAEAQAKLRQTEKELEPLQTRINAFLRDNATRRTMTRLIELFTTLLQAVDRGVGLTAVVLMAERLVNDREAHALVADSAGAAIGILQEARGRAQAERDRIGQFAARCSAVAQRIAAARAKAHAHLVAHPYADVDLTDAALVARLQADIPPPLPGDLARLLELDEDGLYQALHDAALAQARQQTSTLSLLGLMEMQAADLESRTADAPSISADLVAATLEAAYRRIAARPVELDRKATLQDLWLVGVPDETNPGFAFEQATLVGAGRRDQIQFVHVQVGIAPHDLSAVTATRQPFEQALAQRNYFVLETLALDDRARQAFALGLAGGVIAVRGGAFALTGADGSDVMLGETVEDALEQLSRRADLVETAEAQFNALPLATAADRMEAYLARGRSVQDELWWEFASYARDRLEVVKHQLTFVNEG